MLSGKSLIRDGLCLFILVFLVRYNFMAQYIKHMPRRKIAKHILRKQINTLKTGASSTLSGVTKQVKKHVKAVMDVKRAQFEDQANALLQQLSKAQTTLDTAELLTDKEKTDLAIEIKTIRSHIEHIKKESTKEPQELGLLSGAALATARVVHKQNLEKKLLQATNATSSVLLTLHNELLEQDKKINPATSVSQGLEYNQSLLI